ncbi:MAG: lysine exporter LysO family protein [Firmicutes bacterium]|nr:lysine exporter LysO family protein [Bacillota bacterium]
MTLLLPALLAGIATGAWPRFPPRWLPWANQMAFFSILALLLAMGAKIGGDPGLLSSLGEMGLRATLLALASVGGSLAAVWLVARGLIPASGPESATAAGEENHPVTPARAGETGSTVPVSLRSDKADNPDPARGKEAGGTIPLILMAVLVGLLYGRFLAPPGLLAHLDQVVTWALVLSFIGVGIDLGYNRQRAWQGLRVLGPAVLLIPLAVGLGTLLGTFLVAPWSGLTVREAMAVGAGFGWYSLAGVLLSQIHGLALGTMAFLANLLRELLALLRTGVGHRCR